MAKNQKTVKMLRLKKDGTPRKERGPMLPEHKAAMQAGRKVNAENKSKALEALKGNDQFQSVKFWTGVDGDLRNTVIVAIQKSQKAEKKAEKAKLEARLAELTADIEG